MDAAWTCTTTQVLKQLNTDPTVGLDSTQIPKRQSKYGLNGTPSHTTLKNIEIPEEPSTPLWELILEQFKDQLVIILLLAAAISFVLAFLETDESQKGTAYVEPIVILLILIANAVVGVVQETNAEKAIEASFLFLKKHV